MVNFECEAATITIQENTEEKWRQYKELPQNRNKVQVLSYEEILDKGKLTKLEEIRESSEKKIYKKK